MAKCTGIWDELFAANAYPTGNPIGFLIEGSANAFIKNDIDSSWVYYTNHNAPSLHIRSQNSLFGGVSTSTDLFYVSILPREDVLSGEWKTIVESHAGSDDIDLIQNSNATFQVSTQCAYEMYRDITNFEVLNYNPYDYFFGDEEFSFDGL